MRKKSFVIAGMGEDGDSISIKSDPVTQSHLIRRGPYYRTPYIGQHGWVSLADPLSHDRTELEDLIESFGDMGLLQEQAAVRLHRVDLLRTLGATPKTNRAVSA